MRLFHIATAADWAAASATGRYTTSTRGRTLAEEGFIHASRGDQWHGVRARYYADVTEPLVLLVIDPDRLTSPVLDEEVPGSTETFPHVYGPIDLDAVVQVIPLDPIPAAATSDAPGRSTPTDPGTQSPGADDAAPASFSRLFLEEMFRNVAMACVVLVVVVLASLAGRAVDDQWGAVTGALLGLVVGTLVVRRLWRRAPAHSRS